MDLEKKTPHYPLERVKALIEQGNFRVTKAAQDTAVRDFGFRVAANLTLQVLALERSDFYKSMTSAMDSRIWQDVYLPTVGGEKAYLKVQIVSDTTVVISFKRSEG